MVQVVPVDSKLGGAPQAIALMEKMRDHLGLPS